MGNLKVAQWLSEDRLGNTLETCSRFERQPDRGNAGVTRNLHCGGFVRIPDGPRATLFLPIAPLGATIQRRDQKMANRSTLLVAAVLLVPGLVSAGDFAHYSSWTEAKTVAAEQNKLLLLDFFSET